jgi:hypothetical protein
MPLLDSKREQQFWREGTEMNSAGRHDSLL